jgi:hypothetical protein
MYNIDNTCSSRTELYGKARKSTKTKNGDIFFTVDVSKIMRYLYTVPKIKRWHWFKEIP